MSRRRKLSTVVREGDRQRSLETLRDHLAVIVEDSSTGKRDKAQLGRLLKDVLAELDELNPVQEESVVDDLARRREARRAAPADHVESAAGGDGSG